VVIAIIAILAAMLFPVFNIVQGRMRRGTFESNLRQIAQAMTLYKADWGVYPDGLYGVAYSAAGPIDTRLTTKTKDPGVFTCPSANPAFKGSNQLVSPINPTIGGNARDRFGRQLWYPARSSYDFQYRPNNPAGTPELHYSLKWTSTAGMADDRRQLYMKDPAGDTVITWCMLHADLDPSGNPRPGQKAVVLFLSGRIQPMPADRMAAWGAGGYPWQVRP
jgi:type II secretory pathway pseudopilin PulG